MSSQNKKKSVALSSVMAGFALTVMKLAVGLMTGSMGIISEAAHSALDLGAAVLTYFAVRIGGKPADETHPYGHGKAESVSALIETGLLFFTTIWIIYEAAYRLIYKNVGVLATWYAFAVVIVSIIIDFSRSRALSKVAKETNSQALEADALHFSSDIWSSAVVLVGLIFVFFGIQGADAIAAIGVAIFVGIAGYRLGRRTIDVLVDAEPAGIAENIKELAVKIDGVTGIERIRVRPLGPSVFVDMVAKVSRKLPLEKVEKIIKQIEDAIKDKIPEADVVVHTRPVQLDNETITESVQILATEHGLSAHDIVIEHFSGKKYISYDLEVPKNLTVGEAHELASSLEESIQEEIGGELEINTHIEPLGTAAVKSAEIPSEERSAVETLIKGLAKEIGFSVSAHNIIIRKIEDRLFITFHCKAAKTLPLEEAHDAVSKMEYLIRQKMPQVKRAVVHIEPK